MTRAHRRKQGKRLAGSRLGCLRLANSGGEEQGDVSYRSRPWYQGRTELAGHQFLQLSELEMAIADAGERTVGGGEG